MESRALQVGDVVGHRFEIRGLLGEGGFGTVYLAYNREADRLIALKTLRDEKLASPEQHSRFAREAEVWVALGRHPYLVRAFGVDRINGRLFIEMDFISPDERGVNTLEKYLASSGPIPLPQALRWSIQFCYAMEYANSRGLRCHRDIKPANIMLGQDHVLRLTDMGLAGTAEGPQPLDDEHGHAAVLSSGTLAHVAGTLPYMSPEQFTSPKACDVRSDIYSFGIVLYQMRSGGALPFRVNTGGNNVAVREWFLQHAQSPPAKLKTRLWPVVEKCLLKEPEHRYCEFGELRSELEALLSRETGETIAAPKLENADGYELNAKAVSLASLGRFADAIPVYDAALRAGADPVAAFSNKAISLKFMHRYAEAVECCDRALKIDKINMGAWLTRGNSLHYLHRYEDALASYDRALALQSCHPFAWNNRGITLRHMGRSEEALQSYQRATQLDPRYSEAWYNQGITLSLLDRKKEAVPCYQKAVGIDPCLAGAWYNLAVHQDELGNASEAVAAFQRFLALSSTEQSEQVDHARRAIRELGRPPVAKAERESEAPKRTGLRRWFSRRESRQNRVAQLVNHAAALVDQKKFREAIEHLDKALKLDPRCAAALVNKGVVFGKLAQHYDAYVCFVKATRLGEESARFAAEYAKSQLFCERRVREVLMKTTEPRGTHFVAVTESGELVVRSDPPGSLHALIMLNAKAELVGIFRLLPDGRIYPHLERCEAEPDGVSGVMFMAAGISMLTPPHARRMLSNWAGLPEDEWSPRHRQQFILAYTHHLQQRLWEGESLSENLRTVASLLDYAVLPSLPAPLSDSLFRYFREMTGNA